MVFRTHGFVLLRRGLRIPGGVLDHQGEEATQPVLGVGSGIEMILTSPTSKGVPPVLFGFSWLFLSFISLYCFALVAARCLSLQVCGWAARRAGPTGWASAGGLCAVSGPPGLSLRYAAAGRVRLGPPASLRRSRSSAKSSGGTP